MSIALISTPASASTRQDKLRVMVVDDSVVIRGMISRWIGAEQDMEVVASLRTGLDAVNQLERVNPDVAVLDIEMPDLDGISALPQLLAKKRDLIIIMASTLTRRNAEISFKALSLGASDYIPKPESTREASAAETFHHDLIQKIRHLGARARRRASPAASPAVAPAPGRAREVSVQPVAVPVAQLPLARRPFSMLAPRVLLIGSSTGGPQALMTLVADIGPVIDLGRCTGCATAAGAPALQHAGAAGAADWLVDGRSAGPDDAGCRHRPGDRSFSGADHPAHAADLHHDSRRASGAREPPAGA